MPIERDQAANLLEALVSLVRMTRTIAHRDATHSLAATPIALLKLVSGTEPRLGDLAEQLRVKPSVASRAVAALEGEGYVSRVTDPDDARACRIQITESGRVYLKGREDWALDMVAKTFSDWTAEDADQSVRVLRRLERSVDDWVGYFEREVTNGTDPLTRPVAADSPPSTTDLSSADIDVSPDRKNHSKNHSMNRTKTWETTAV